GRSVPPSVPDQVSAAVRDRHRRRRSLNSHAVELDDPRLYRSAMRHFKSWKEVLVAARLPKEVIAKATGIRTPRTKASVLAALHARHRSGKSMAAGALSNQDN